MGDNPSIEAHDARKDAWPGCTSDLGFEKHMFKFHRNVPKFEDIGPPKYERMALLKYKDTHALESDM